MTRTKDVGPFYCSRPECGELLVTGVNQTAGRAKRRIKKCDTHYNEDNHNYLIGRATQIKAPKPTTKRCPCGLQIEPKQFRCRTCQTEYSRNYYLMKKEMGLTKAAKPRIIVAPEVCERSVLDLSPMKQAIRSRVLAQMSRPDVVESLQKPYNTIIKTIVLPLPS